MPNVDIFTIKANSEIITAIHERVKGSCISTDLCGSGKELTCDVNWHFNNEIVGALKEISKERDCIVTFAFVEDANYYTEKHHHEDIRYQGGKRNPPKYLGNGSFVAA